RHTERRRRAGDRLEVPELVGPRTRIRWFGSPGRRPGAAVQLVDQAPVMAARVLVFAHRAAAARRCTRKADEHGAVVLRIRRLRRLARRPRTAAVRLDETSEQG